MVRAPRQLPALASTEFVLLASRASLAPQVLWAACNSRPFTASLTERVSGTTGSHRRVSPDDVLTTAVPDPRTLSETRVKLITSLVDQAEVARLESVHLAKLRDALLPKLMSGQVRVRVTETLARAGQGR